MVKLEDQNGLYKFVKEFVIDGLEMWFDVRIGKVTLYYSNLVEGITREMLKIKISDYIGRHMLIESYKTVTIINW